MRTARINRPSPMKPNAASRADTLNQWLTERYGFDMRCPYSCREERTIDAGGNVESELIYEQDDGAEIHAHLRVVA